MMKNIFVNITVYRHCEPKAKQSGFEIRLLRRIKNAPRNDKAKHVVFAFLAVFLLASPVLADEKKIKIVATTSTFASLAGEIAGDQAEIYFIASPKRDIHFITPTPKDVLKVKKGNVFVHGGLDLEVWRSPLLNAAGKREFLPGGGREIDVSAGIELLEIPVEVTRLEGDIHAFGNPHYWMDPVNAERIAQNIADGLARIYPSEAERFQKNARDFRARFQEKLKGWSERMQPYRGQSMVTYHRNWPYFANRFGLKVVGQIEPKPGIPPTAKHLSQLMKSMKEQGVKIIVRESSQEKKTPDKIGQQTGAFVLILTQAVGEPKEAVDYFSMIEYNVGLLAEALSKQG